MPAPQKPKPRALCACGCRKRLPAVRRKDMKYINIEHWRAANRERENARRRERRKTPQGRARLRAQMRKWRREHPEEWKAIARRAQKKARLARTRYNREWRRRKAVAIVAQPKPVRLPGVFDAGLRIAKRGERLSDWREDAAQDRVLRELERAAAQRSS